MRVYGVLGIDLTPFVDELGLLDAREAGFRMPRVPVGVSVELDISKASTILGGFGDVLRALRSAGSVVVVGSDPAGITDVVRRLRVAFPEQAS